MPILSIMLAFVAAPMAARAHPGRRLRAVLQYGLLACAATFGANAHAYDITVAASGPSSGGAWSGDTWTANAPGATVPTSEIEAHLANGPTSIRTGTSGDDPGDIDIAAAVNWNANTLTLSAARDVHITAALTGTGSAALTLEYGQGAVAASNTGIYRISVPVTLPSNPTDPVGIPSFTTRRGSDGAAVARAIPQCPVSTRYGTTYGCSFLKTSNLTALTLQYSTVEVKTPVDTLLWLYVDLRALAADPFYPYVMSCDGGSGQLYYPTSKDQALYFDTTGAILNAAQLDALTTTTRPCKTWDLGPVTPLLPSTQFPNGYYVKFSPKPGESGHAYQIMSLLVTQQLEANTGYSVVDYIIDVVPAAPAIAGTGDIAIPLSGAKGTSFTLTGTGALKVTAQSDNAALLPDANITGATLCTAMGPCALTLTPLANQTGTATVTVAVSDSYSQTATASFEVTVTALTVSYDGNGSTSGSAPVDGLSYPAGGAATVLAQGDLARAGYSFSGWNTQSDGRGIHYVAGDTVTVNNSIMLFAEWHPHTTSVTLGGGAFSLPWLGLLLLAATGRRLRKPR
jgi:hypothetical protein